MIMAKSFKVAILPGDGIGPEVMAEALKVLDAVEKKYAVSFERTLANVGGAGIDNEGKALPAVLVDQNGKVCPRMSSPNEAHCCHCVKYLVCFAICGRQLFFLP
jgi:hypothetical protein